MASPSLLLLQSEKSEHQMSCLIQSSDQIHQDDQNFLSVSAAAAATSSAEDTLSTNLSSLSSLSSLSTSTSTSTATSITEPFASSRLVEDSYRPNTSILGSTGGEPPDFWRKSSADTTHDISELELDTITETEITELARQEQQGRQARRQCTLL